MAPGANGGPENHSTCPRASVGKRRAIACQFTDGGPALLLTRLFLREASLDGRPGPEPAVHP